MENLLRKFHIQSKYRKMQTRKNSIFGHVLRSARTKITLQKRYMNISSTLSYDVKVTIFLKILFHVLSSILLQQSPCFQHSSSFLNNSGITKKDLWNDDIIMIERDKVMITDNLIRNTNHFQVLGKCFFVIVVTRQKNK